MNLDLQLKKAFNTFYGYIKSLNPNKRKYLIIGTVAILIISIALPLILRLSDGGPTTVLYKGLSAQERSEIFGVLQEMNIPVTIDGDGELRVSESQINLIKLRLSTLGYPQSALSYPVFTSNAGFMATELEKKQYLIIDLQNRLAETIRQIDGVSKSIVTLNIPDDTSYVWQSNSTTGSASVLLTLKTSKKLDSDFVLGIKNLVASSVPRMKSEDVRVIDASSGAELSAQLPSNSFDSNFLQLEFESEIERRMQEKVLNLLSLPYGIENVRVSSSVEIDYDKILTEELNYVPGSDGKGIISKIEEWYSANGNASGETGNPDIPIYQQGDDETVIEKTYSAEYLVSTIRRQIEKNGAELKSATVSVVINDHELDQQKIENWTKSIANALNVDPAMVMIHSIGKTQQTPIDEVEDIFEQYGIYIVGAGMAFAVLVVFIMFFLYLRKSKKTKKPLKDSNTTVQQKPVSVTPNTDIMENIGQFAQQNPEIAANLIKDMLKEDL